MSSSPGPSLDPDDIRRFREANRDLFSDAAVRNPHVFVSTDNPLQGLAPPQIRKAMERLGDIAGAEGSAIVDTDWLSEVDSSISLGENVAHLLEIGGKLPEDETGFAGLSGQPLSEEDAENAERNRAVEEIIEVCQQLDEAGADGAEILENVFAGATEDVAADVEAAGFDPDEIERLLASIEDGFGTTLVSDAIAECRDLLPGPLEEASTDADVILDELNERFDLDAISLETAVGQLEDEVERVRERAGTLEEQTARDIEQAAVNRLSRRFGMQFDNLDDAVQRIQEQIAIARGERLRTADIRVRRVTGETRVFIDSDDPVFDEWRDNAERRVRRELDLEAIEPPQTVSVGRITVRDDALEEIDLESGRQRLGAVAEPEPLEAERRGGLEREQAELPEATSDLDELADRAIELMADNVLAFAREFDADEVDELVEGLFTAQLGQAREERLRELIDDAPPTLREDAVAEQPEFADLEEVLGFMPSEPPPDVDVDAEPAIRERSQAEEVARQTVEDLIEANIDDAETLANLARALEEVDADLSGLLSQERLQALATMDREQLASTARNAARRAEPRDISDFPDLERALRRRGGRDAAYFENVADELRGDRDLDTLARQDVDEATLDELNEFSPEVLEAAIDRAEENARALRGDGRETTPDRGAPGPTLPGAGDFAERAISARVRQTVPSSSQREDPITGEEFSADPGLEQAFLEWVIDVKGDTDRFDRHYFESSPERRRNEFIAMQAWARLQVKAGNSTIQSAERAGLPQSWFSGL